MDSEQSTTRPATVHLSATSVTHGVMSLGEWLVRLAMNDAEEE